MHPTSTQQQQAGEGSGIVRLKLTPIDADWRREMYGQPLLEPSSSSSGVPLLLSEEDVEGCAP